MSIDRETESIIAALLAYDTCLHDRPPSLPNRMKAMALALKAAGDTTSQRIVDGQPSFDTTFTNGSTPL